MTNTKHAIFYVQHKPNKGEKKKNDQIRGKLTDLGYEVNDIKVRDINTLGEVVLNFWEETSTGKRVHPSQSKAIYGPLSGYRHMSEILGVSLDNAA